VVVPDELTLVQAWEETLTGDRSFYLGPDGDPYRHFATDIAASPQIIGIVGQLLAVACDGATGPLTVVDVGSGAGGLLTRLALAGTHARLIGIDLRPRPLDLDPGIDWITGDARQVAAELGGIRGVVVAHEGVVAARGAAGEQREGQGEGSAHGRPPRGCAEHPPPSGTTSTPASGAGDGDPA
jgi:SAM-dependent methyltransferase